MASSDRDKILGNDEPGLIDEKIDRLRSIQNEVREITSLVEGPEIPETVEVDVEINEGWGMPDDHDTAVIAVNGVVTEFGPWLDTLMNITEWDQFEIRGRQLTARKRIDIE